MPDFIDRLGAELVRAASAEPRSARAARLRRRPRWLASMRLRGLLIVPVLALLGTGAAVAGGILLTGAPAGPRLPAVPTAGYGAAATTQLLPLHVADPAGGPPWGMRAVRTTRDDVCLQIGRLADGTIGALGEDGSFGDDHRFHPFSVNYEGPDQLGCVPLDARGHGFTADVLTGLPTSAMAAGGCVAEFNRRDQLPCPRQNTRDVYFGLLGPEAASITYTSAGGQTVTDPTVGPDGAYLIVTRALLAGQQGGGSGFASLFRTGPIRAVTYRDGHTCRPTAVSGCAPVGLVPAGAPHLAEAALASPIHVQEIPDSSATPPLVLLRITYTARVAVTSTGSFYYTSLFYPNVRTCHQIATGSETTTNIRAGQTLVDHGEVLASCRGVVHGLVRYHPASAIHSPAPEPDPVDPGDIVVGRFSLRLP
jgi:hypothetical protein